MSRLIDADALIKEYPQASGLKLVIENAPTAFDREKVAEQLEEKKAKFQKEMEDCIFKGLPYHDSLEGQIIGIIDAIDIVKKGGVE